MESLFQTQTSVYKNLNNEKEIKPSFLNQDRFFGSKITNKGVFCGSYFNPMQNLLTETKTDRKTSTMKCLLDPKDGEK